MKYFIFYSIAALFAQQFYYYIKCEQEHKLAIKNKIAKRPKVGAIKIYFSEN
jgi:hypothetical protein